MGGTMHWGKGYHYSLLLQQQQPEEVKIVWNSNETEMLIVLFLFKVFLFDSVMRFEKKVQLCTFFGCTSIV